MRCPACATENRDDALVCTMCKRVLRHEGDALPEVDPRASPHHTIDLPEGAAPRSLELADKRFRHSERPAPPPGGPGTNPTSARSISHRPPPPPAPEIPWAERALDRAARPLETLLWLSVPAPGASAARRVPIVGIVLHLAGIALVVWPFAGASIGPAIAVAIACLAIAVGAGAWAGRSVRAGADPSPVAVAGATLFPAALIAAIAVGGVGALAGGFVRPEPGAAIEVTPLGRALIGAAIAIYVALLGALAARDRLRSARERAGGSL